MVKSRSSDMLIQMYGSPCESPSKQHMHNVHAHKSRAESISRAQPRNRISPFQSNACTSLVRHPLLSVVCMLSLPVPLPR
jgi:hypothetical protein